MNTTPAAKQPDGRGGTLYSPVNVISAVLIIMGLFIFVARFIWGIGGVTALDNKNPWGLWVTFDLLCGITLAAGGYMTSCAVYLFGMEKFRPVIRPAIATAFLGYLFEVAALLADVGQPWRLPYPFVVSPGTSSILFMVGLCVVLYLLVSFVEWSRQLMEGLNKPYLRGAHAAATKLLLPLTVLGASVAIIHQASLGALYLIAPAKIHPLWYSPLLPAFFLVSSMYAGLSMAVVESSLARASKSLRACMDAAHRDSCDGIVLGFGRAAGVIMLACFLIRAFDLISQGKTHYLNTGYGALFLTEMLGFVLLPCLLFLCGARAGKTRIVKAAALLAVLGIILNRFNVSLVAYNWLLPPAERYFPSLMEIGFSVAMVAAIVTLYRIFAAFLPMLREQPAFRENAG